MRKRLQSGEFSAAILEARADITKYTIWHKSHTELLLRTAPTTAEELLGTDIRALAHLVELLLYCFLNAGRSSEFPVVLERLRSNINDPRWHRKITYFHALHALSPDWDERKGRRELRKLGSVKEEEDVEILQLYLDLFGEELSFSEGIEIIDRILLYVDNEVDRLHYSGTRASQYLLIGDQDKAASELETALTAFRQGSQVSKLSSYALYRLAASLELLGSIREDVQLLDEAIELYERLLNVDDWTPNGLADILRKLGDAHRCKGSWSQAKEAYERALAYDPLPILNVLLAESLLQIDGWSPAASEIDSIDVEALSDPEYADYVFAVSAIAIESNDVERLNEAESLLRALDLSIPYVREQRDSLLLCILEAQRTGTSSSLTQRVRRAMRRTGASALRYVKLEPNIMGIGINMGRILEDFMSGNEKQASQQDQRRKKNE